MESLLQSAAEGKEIPDTLEVDHYVDLEFLDLKYGAWSTQECDGLCGIY